MASDPYEGRPASIKQVVQYTAAGGWVPGNHSGWWEAPGYVYGCLVAIPLTVVFNAAAWLPQRCAQVAALAVGVGLLWWAGVQPTGPWWVYALWLYASLVVGSIAAVLGARGKASDGPPS